MGMMLQAGAVAFTDDGVGVDSTSVMQRALQYTGMLGALQMELADGRRFALGSGLTDALRRKPPPLGTLITYRYRELTQDGMPRFARYLRVRDTP